MNIYDPYEYGITQWHDSLPGGMLALYWIILGISIAAMWIMWFIRRFPARERRWRTISPEDASMGAVPVQDAYRLRSSRPAGQPRTRHRRRHRK